MGKRNRKWEETCGELPLTGISYTFCHQFSTLFIYRRNNPRMSENLHCFSRTFSFVKRSEISARSKMAEALDVCMYMYPDLFCDIPQALYLMYSDIPEFILHQIFNGLIGRKLGLLQKIKTKQLFIVFDWNAPVQIVRICK